MGGSFPRGGEPCDADETEEQGGDSHRTGAGAAGPRPLGEHNEEWAGADEESGEAGRDVLLGPDDGTVAAEKEEGPDDGVGAPLAGRGPSGTAEF